eukprot:11215099-Lingulodinium_polyedra.AAC.1
MQPPGLGVRRGPRCPFREQLEPRGWPLFGQYHAGFACDAPFGVPRLVAHTGLPACRRPRRRRPRRLPRHG